jgi:hypothetical protein
MIRPAAHISLPERVGKKVRHLFVWLGDWVARSGHVPPVVVAFPDLPSRRTTLHKVCRKNRWELTNVPRSQALVTLRFEDATIKSQPMPAAVTGLVWNASCTDISKSTLDKHHIDVFGYGVGLDPLTFQGPLLEKSDANAAHDGIERQGPLPFRSPGKVYQHIIDNRDKQGRVVDLRLVYVCGQTPVTYFKFKSDEARYSNETTDVALAETETCFTDDELHLVAELMTRLGVDVAELDILRDRSTQSIFVVDVNPTPWGPPAGLNPKDAAQAIETIATAFRHAIEADQLSK